MPIATALIVPLGTADVPVTTAVAHPVDLPTQQVREMQASGGRGEGREFSRGKE